MVNKLATKTHFTPYFAVQSTRGKANVNMEVEDREIELPVKTPKRESVTVTVPMLVKWSSGDGCVRRTHPSPLPAAMDVFGEHIHGPYLQRLMRSPNTSVAAGQIAQFYIVRG